MADPEDILKLPPGIDAPDPVDGNPFPENDLRHGFWKRATAEAEEEACRLNDAFIRARPNTLEGMLRWDMEYFVGRYNIWARRGVRVVLTREMIPSWDTWLANYANEMLKTFGAFSPSDIALQKLRDGLIGRREYWKAEGRRNVALQEARQAGAIQRKGTPSELTDPSPAAATAAVPVELEPEKASTGSHKRGPRPNYDEAGRVATIVGRIAPDGDWRSKLEDICEALDEAGVPPPKTWTKQDPPERNWCACSDSARLVKAVEYRLKTARRQPGNPPAETSS